MQASALQKLLLLLTKRLRLQLAKAGAPDPEVLIFLEHRQHGVVVWIPTLLNRLELSREALAHGGEDPALELVDAVRISRNGARSRLLLPSTSSSGKRTRSSTTLASVHKA
jgi:hypothetical protein